MIRVHWPDGHITEARSWTWLARRVQSDRWNRPYRDIRAELARRCYVWTGTLVDPRLPAPEFWRALDRAGMVRLEVGPRA